MSEEGRFVHDNRRTESCEMDDMGGLVFLEQFLGLHWVPVA